MEKNVSRKKFIGWAIGLGSLAIVPVFFRSHSGKKSEATTAKMLTQDGQLVEIDVANIPVKKRKLAMADIHRWITKRNPR